MNCLRTSVNKSYGNFCSFIEFLIVDDFGTDEDDSSVFEDYIGRKTEKLVGPKIWGRWGKWSACSNSCGTGQMTRWRTCIDGGCAEGESEEQIKVCNTQC